MQLCTIGGKFLLHDCHLSLSLFALGGSLASLFFSPPLGGGCIFGAYPSCFSVWIFYTVKLLINTSYHFKYIYIYIYLPKGGEKNKEAKEPPKAKRERER
eukprot:TRINITY_DN4110_c0_g2_i1.p1 TRINITY_DN4110_c0_g2~~TRINITY_DN4110_c0_g2_i1.p1  ORF type:complete len:100 (+),score=15.53 TRINITY_DN4110_c0_g2_i1:343-642(+)